MITTKEAKTYLLQAYKAAEVLKQCDSELSELITFSQGLVSSYGEKLGDGKMRDTGDFVAKIEQLKEEIGERQYEWLKKRREIKQFILKVEVPADEEYIRTLLFERYINFKSFEEIACKINYNYYHVVKYLHPKALRYVIKTYNKRFCKKNKICQPIPH